MMKFAPATRNRKTTDTDVPITPPTTLNVSKRPSSAAVASAIAAEASTTMVEWPSEKNKPTATGRLPSCISLRVTLSMAAIWSASTAWRSPNV